MTTLWVKWRMIWAILCGRPVGYRISSSSQISLRGEKGLLVKCVVVRDEPTSACFVLEAPGQCAIDCIAIGFQAEDHAFITSRFHGDN